MGGHDARRTVLARRSRCCDLAPDGLADTLAKIGADLGVSRARVRKLVARSPWPTSAIRAARAHLAEENRARFAREAAAWSDAHPGAPIAEGARALAVTQTELKTALGKRSRAHEPTARRSVASRTPDSALLDALRECHSEHGSITAATYNRWARQHGVPGSQTVAQRFGSWNGALAQAGLTDRPGIVRERMHSDSDLWAAVVEGLRADPAMTAREWDQWSRPASWGAVIGGRASSPGVALGSTTR